MKHIFIFLSLIFITCNAYADYITHNVSGGCDNNTLYIFDNVSILYPEFTINTYNCANGYYLPADGLGCVACPSGYNCPGGTYEYNPQKNQGIFYKKPISENVYHGCSINLLFPEANTITKLEPVFIPKPITINWDDGDNTVQNTCEYGKAITLPPPPTRPGYEFVGWKVKNQ